MKQRADRDQDRIDITALRMAHGGGGVTTDAARRSACDNSVMTLIWFIVWLIAGRAGLHFDPVDWWTGTLLLAIALDLGRQHAGPAKRAKKLG